MKNLHLRLITVAALTVFAVVACKKDKDQTETPGSSAKLSATINDAAFKPSDTSVSAVHEYGFITITGTQVQSGDTQTFALDIPDTTFVGSRTEFLDRRITYNRSKKSDVTFYSFYNGSHGYSSVTSWDKTNKKIAGTFSGVVYSTTMEDSIVITNGQFNTDYKQ